MCVNILPSSTWGCRDRRRKTEVQGTYIQEGKGRGRGRKVGVWEKSIYGWGKRGGEKSSRNER